MSETLALEGLGAKIRFNASGFESDLIALTLSPKARATIDTTHLGTETAKTKRPGQTQDLGTIEAVFDHDPAAVSLVGRPAEQVIITYPEDLGHEFDPIVLWAFATEQGGERMFPDGRMVTAVVLSLSVPDAVAVEVSPEQTHIMWSRVATGLRLVVPSLFAYPEADVELVAGYGLPYVAGTVFGFTGYDQGTTVRIANVRPTAPDGDWLGVSFPLASPGVFPGTLPDESAPSGPLGLEALTTTDTPNLYSVLALSRSEGPLDGEMGTSAYGWISREVMGDLYEVNVDGGAYRFLYFVLNDPSRPRYTVTPYRKNTELWSFDSYVIGAPASNLLVRVSDRRFSTFTVA